MLAKLHCERVGVLIMGVAVWAGGMTSTPGPRGDQVHRFSNDGVVTLPGDMAAWTRCRNDPAFVASLAPFFDSIMLGRRFHVGRSASGGLQGRVPREHVRPMRRPLWIGCQSGAAHVDDFAIQVRAAQACLIAPKGENLALAVDRAAGCPGGRPRIMSSNRLALTVTCSAASIRLHGRMADVPIRS